MIGNMHYNNYVLCESLREIMVFLLVKNFIILLQLRADAQMTLDDFNPINIIMQRFYNELDWKYRNNNLSTSRTWTDQYNSEAGY